MRRGHERAVHRQRNAGPALDPMVWRYGGALEAIRHLPTT